MKIRRRLKRTAVADMTPMIDIIFQLVIFFMISSVFNTAPGIDIELPQGESVQTMEITPLVVTITGTEDIYLNKNLIPFNSLKEALQDYKESIDDKTTNVVLKGDKDVSYGTFVQVMGVLRSTGYSQINMITDTKQD
ncbi:biopolymer transporter ExbD [Thiospirochaeta perfilievii]|uniref:Biopolymer transporter ExbD n=1 Tax=Thiospirochaeta perfilievii TaxID=252967 RepID=A0A5C1Q8D7_9SPIO|nr:biopolymer transporter ExbD [Thiospirochaeta perfilievii]QEN03618.1 biopolymer transporter ExbD [Thiospirochaeta perfilievii]